MCKRIYIWAQPGCTITCNIHTGQAIRHLSHVKIEEWMSTLEASIVETMLRDRQTWYFQILPLVLFNPS